MKILIGVPPLNKRGGIAAFYVTLQDRLGMNVEYFLRGSRPGGRKPLVQFCMDYLGFLLRVSRRDIKLVQLNVSLGAVGICRDAVFIILSRCFNKKIIVYFHGWDRGFQAKLEDRFMWLFKRIYFGCDAMIVLARDFEETLRAWGYEGPVFQETTVIDEEYFSVGASGRIEASTRDPAEQRILFLARVEKTKGVYELVEAFDILSGRFPNLRLTVAGEGSELEPLKRFVKQRGIGNVEFPGYVAGEQKRKAFAESDVYVLPSYGEGLPISVLEAMAFGLPVVTTAVGGLCELVEEGKCGHLINAPEPALIADRIASLLDDRELRAGMGRLNAGLARHFVASRVAERLRGIWESVHSGNVKNGASYSWRDSDKRFAGSSDGQKLDEFGETVEG